MENKLLLCINNSQVESELRLNKIYRSIGKNGECFIIKSELDINSEFFERRFKILPDTKASKILFGNYDE